MNTTEHGPGIAARPRGQLKLLVIVLVVLGPILIAWLMAKTEIGIPQSHTNKSDLVEPMITLADWQLPLDADYGAPWRLLVTSPDACTEACLALIHEARQLNVAVGREADRVEHVVALGAPAGEPVQTRLQNDFPRLQQTTLSPAAYQDSLTVHPDSWRQGAQLWVIDPLGRVVLHRNPEHPGKHLLDDLRHLLKVSKVG